MGFYILTWVLTAHIIYMFVACQPSNILDDNLIEKYLICFGWPILPLAMIILLIFKTLYFIISELNDIWNLLGDIYWDISYFITYIKTIWKPW